MASQKGRFFSPCSLSVPRCRRRQATPPHYRLLLWQRKRRRRLRSAQRLQQRSAAAVSSSGQQQRSAAISSDQQRSAAAAAVSSDQHKQRSAQACAYRVSGCYQAHYVRSELFSHSHLRGRRRHATLPLSRCHRLCRGQMICIRGQMICIRQSNCPLACVPQSYLMWRSIHISREFSSCLYT
jgi:hypothetical protein